MKLTELKCPNCQAELSLQENQIKSQIVYCPYCGTKIALDDEVKRYEYTHNININKETHIYDEAKIHQYTADKAKYSADAEKAKADAYEMKYVVILIIFLFLSLFVMEGNEKGYFDGVIQNITAAFDKEATISVPFDSSEIEKSSTVFTYYVNELKDAGFTNIKTHEVPDIVWGFTKAYSIDEISINGHTHFKTGNKFRPDTEIIVSYHVNAK